MTVETSRLILRRWCDADVTPFAEMNADPQVMRLFPSLLTYEQSAHMVERIEAHFVEHGFGLWAVELKQTGQFAGFIGLAVPRFEAAFTPCVEIGWRIAVPFWNQGYATEGAQAALKFGFEQCRLTEILSFTVPANIASQRVMEKIGMTYVSDFEHPVLANDDPLCTHVLYRITKQEWDLAHLS